MKNNNSYLITFTVLLVIQMGCEQERDKYYDEPSWLSGPLMDQVRAAGEYSEYVALAESVGFESVLNSAGNYTIFVPTNEAFQAYYDENDFTDFNSLSEEERLKLLRYNTLDGSWTRERILTKTSFGFWVEDQAPVNFKTRSIYREDIFTEVSVIDGLNKALYSGNKYVPIFSEEFFSTQGYEVSDYTFFYPGSEWNGFNVGRARIIEEEFPAENGFYYVVDKVVVPPLTADRLITTDSQFEVFSQLTQRLAVYSYNEAETINAGADSVFNKLHNLSMNLADERTRYGNSPETDGIIHPTVFIPSNDALTNYLNTNFNQYGSIENIPVDLVQELVNNHIIVEPVTFPSQLDSIIDPQADVFYKTNASNAFVYGINKVIEPELFFAVTGPLFFSPDYSVFKNMLQFSGLIPTLTNGELEFTVFALSNTTLANAGYSFALRPGGDPLNVNDFLFFRNEGSNDVLLTPTEIKDFVELHLLFRDVEASGEGFAPSFTGFYVGYDNNAVFGGGDQEGATSVNVISSVDRSNGSVYEIDNVLLAPSMSIEDYILNDPDFSEFRTLCESAGLISSGTLILLDVTNTYTAAIPTNDVLTAMSGSIPADPEELKQFLRYHCLRNEVFTTDEFSDNVSTERIDTDRSDEFETFFESILITANGSGIQVTDGQGNDVFVVADDRNIITTNGVIHRIDNILQF